MLSAFPDLYFPLKNSLSGKEYLFSPKNITWASDSELYKKTKYKLSEIVPPPNWIKNFPELMDGKGNYARIPKIWKDERFQNWMRVAGNDRHFCSLDTSLSISHL